MRNVFSVFIIFSILIAEILGRNPGCNYFDTVDLTNSTKYTNGSYQYENVLIPEEQTGEYDYEILFSGDQEKVPRHIRGCVCHLKPCIRFCCNPKQTLVRDKRECADVDPNLNYNTFINITYNETQIKNINVLELMVQQHLPVPCDNHLSLNPEIQEHGWTLYEDGTLLRHYDYAQLSKGDYCLQPEKFSNKYVLVPHHCLMPKDLTNAYVQSVSIFFMIMVISVYLILPNFKGDYGKCCICYFGCLTISFTLIVILRFDWVKTDQDLLCQLLGYFGYYTTISTFLWLLIINFDLWKTFNSIGISRRTRFLKYNIFVWGIASLHLLYTFLAEFLMGRSKWSPNIGVYACWIDTAAWSAVIYFFGPMCICLIFNTALFVITACHIFAQNRINRHQLTKSESQRKLRTLANFGMFFRLFVIMGVIWILDIISYVGGMFELPIEFIDVINCSQGIILFVATILKRDVLHSLANRLAIKRKCMPIAASTTLAGNAPSLEINSASKEALTKDPRRHNKL